ncbi:unnamed protein product, partial [marine sediment metagenome]
WNDVEPEIISSFVGLVERLDGAVRFGRSRDRAVYSIGFYVDTERWTEWIRDTDDRDMEFRRIYDEIFEDFGLESDLPGGSIPPDVP